MKYLYCLSMCALVVQAKNAFAYNLDCRSDDSPYRVELTSDAWGRWSTGKVTKNNQNVPAGDLSCSFRKPPSYVCLSIESVNGEWYIFELSNNDNPIVDLNFLTYSTSTIVAELPCWKS